jgi:predicted O-methyltransferase YrrM
MKKNGLRLAHRILQAALGLIENQWIYSLLVSAGVPEASKIPTHTTKEELKGLLQLARTCPQQAVALEIGAYLGASTCYLAVGLKQVEGSLMCVDTWQNETMPEGVKDTLSEFKRNTRGVATQITMIRKKSQELEESDVNCPLNLVFIDGDHSYASVKEDFMIVQPWLAKGAVVAFHDCLHFQGVSQFIGETVATGEWQMTGLINNLMWIKKAENWSG